MLERVPVSGGLSVIVRGGEAEELLTARRLVARGPAHASVDEVESTRLRVARVWHTAAAGALRSRRGRALLIVQLDGALAFSADEGRSQRSGELRPGELLLVTAHAEASIVAAEATARIEFETRVRGLTTSPAVLHTGETPPDGWAGAAAVSLANAALNAGLSSDSPDLDLFGVAVESCCTALVQSAFPDAIGERSLGERAMDVIDREASDPAFSVARLADRVGITRQHLAVVFAREGRRTPLQEIRRARVARARDQLRGAEGRRPLLRDVARVSGFGSEDALRRALREA